MYSINHYGPNFGSRAHPYGFLPTARVSDKVEDMTSAMFRDNKYILSQSRDYIRYVIMSQDPSV